MLILQISHPSLFELASSCGYLPYLPRSWGSFILHITLPTLSISKSTSDPYLRWVTCMLLLSCGAFSQIYHLPSYLLTTISLPSITYCHQAVSTSHIIPNLGEVSSNTWYYLPWTFEDPFKTHIWVASLTRWCLYAVIWRGLTHAYSWNSYAHCYGNFFPDKRLRFLYSFWSLVFLFLQLISQSPDLDCKRDPDRALNNHEMLSSVSVSVTQCSSKNCGFCGYLQGMRWLKRHQKWVQSSVVVGR